MEEVIIGTSALVDDETKCLLATMHTRFLETDTHKLGTLVITYDGMQTLDLAVVSALVLQERSEEGKWSVCPPVFSRLTEIVRIGQGAHQCGIDHVAVNARDSSIDRLLLRFIATKYF
jgi:hypothetical protein